MSEEQLTAFLEVLKSDTSLQEKLKLEQDANVLLEIAKAIGLGTSSFSTEDQLRLSAEELEGVAGGCTHSNSFGGQSTYYFWKDIFEGRNPFRKDAY